MFFPLNSKNANAYAAIEAIIIRMTLHTKETNRELTRKRGIWVIFNA